MTMSVHGAPAPSTPPSGIMHVSSLPASFVHVPVHENELGSVIVLPWSSSVKVSAGLLALQPGGRGAQSNERTCWTVIEYVPSTEPVHAESKAKAKSLDTRRTYDRPGVGGNGGVFALADSRVARVEQPIALRYHRAVRAVLLVLAACGGPHEPPSATSIVTLREPGASPQHAIQYAPRAGTRRLNVISGDARTSRGMTFVVDLEMTAATSPIHVRFHGIDALIPAGNHSSGSDVSDPDIGEFVRHVAGTVASDVHGRATANADSDHVWTTPSLPNALTMSIVPLPTEPIGIGAQWHVTGADPALAVTDAAFDYTATALDADGATVRWTGKAIANGTAVALDGTATVRFTELVPVRATIVQHVPASSPDIPAIDVALAIE